jgi:hypothetical protein
VAVSLRGCGKQTLTPAAPPPTVKVTMAKPVEKEIVDFAEFTETPLLYIRNPSCW